eukprot:IDg22449t1
MHPTIVAVLLFKLYRFFVFLQAYALYRTFIKSLETARRYSTHSSACISSFVTLGCVSDGSRFICDDVCANRSLRSTIPGISMKRRVDYGEKYAKLYEYGDYESENVKETEVILESNGRIGPLQFKLQSDDGEENAVMKTPITENVLSCDNCGMRYTTQHNCGGKPT